MKESANPSPHQVSIPLYPIFSLSYFFLHVWAENFERGLRFSLLFRPYAISLLVVILVWQFLGWLFKSASKAAFFTFYLSFCFFSYGHFRSLLLTYVIRMPIPQMVFISIFIALAVLIPSFFLFRSRAEFKLCNTYLNVVTGILLFFPLGYIAPYTLYAQPQLIEYAEPLPEFTRHPDPLPDIYYIILDEYARQDTLKSEYNFDNTAFLEALRKKGFFIADKSRSNYQQTDYSLSSSLNMRYLLSVDEDFPDLVKNNLVSRALKLKLGYRYVFMNSGCVLTDASPTADELISYIGANDVELLMANTTMVNAFTAFFFAESWRYRHKYNFARLEQMPERPGPKFVFAHFLLPHPPFVFNQDGTAFQSNTIRLTPLPFSLAHYHEAYPKQVAYVNGKILKLVDELISKSRTPPIIIIQSDHGLDPIIHEGDSPNSYLLKRSANLTALFLPGDGVKDFPESITPVNIFRILFSHYFGANLPALEDKMFMLHDTEDRPVFESITRTELELQVAKSD